MALFSYGDSFKDCGNCRETFFSGGCCKRRIHVGPFFIFAGGGSLEIVKSGSDDTGRIAVGNFNDTAF